MALKKVNRRLRIRKGIRRKIAGTASTPRLSVFRSNKAIYAQIIDDEAAHTLTACSSSEIGKAGVVNVEVSKEVGKKLAEKAQASGIGAVIFDRGGYKYHGNVKALAEGAREGGLKF